MDERPPCADVSRNHDEPLSGTASRVRNWLLVEQDGTWGQEAVSESGLRPEIAARLKREAARNHIRLLLIKRSDGADTGKFRCFAGHSGVDAQWVQRLPVGGVDDVLDIDLTPLRAGTRLDLGEPWPDPLYLVCTNGAHDPCCDRLGAPAARGLARARPAETWESSHVGGDRFAANLVCLPHGLYFGRVDADAAVEVAALYESGLIHLDHYRGRSCFEPVVQAADIFIRTREELLGIDDLEPTWRRDREGGRSTLGFRDCFGEEHEVEVAVRRGAARPITCSAAHPGAPREYHVFDADDD